MLNSVLEDISESYCYEDGGSLGGAWDSLRAQYPKIRTNQHSWITRCNLVELMVRNNLARQVQADANASN